MLDRKELGSVARYLLQARREEAPRLEEIRRWVRDEVCAIYVPKSATEEYRQLVDQSRFNILDRLVSAVANNLFIDGYRPKRKAENSPVWDEVWQPNRMDARQGGVFRSALTYGASYARVLPGQLRGKPSAVITPFSPRRMTCLYEDAINDEWAQYALAVSQPRPDPTGKYTKVVTIAVYDATHEYKMDVPAAAAWTPKGSEATPPSVMSFSFDLDRAEVGEHGLGVTPVVRFLPNRADLDDGSPGVVWPMLPAQRQLNQTTFGLKLAELYAAFKQRWVTGLALPEDEDGNPIEPFNIAVNRLLVAEDQEVKFGEFSETSLDGYLNSRDKTLLFVASKRQIPPHTLVVGNAVSNISAEALAALEAGHQQDIAECKTSLGEDAEQMLRLGALAAGNEDGWEDTSASVRWRDTTPRSLAQIADALGKLATLLGVPARALWERIPDVTDDDLEQWEQLAEKEADEEQERALVGLMGGRGARANGQPADTPAPA